MVEKLTIQLELPPKLEKQLEYLEKISGKSRDFIFYEALIRYIEELEDIQKFSVWEALGILDEIRERNFCIPKETNERLKELKKQ